MLSEAPPSPFAGLDLPQLNARLAQASALERVRWAHEIFGERLVLSTSFGAQSAVMLHLSTQVWPEIPVVFVDTGYLFPETYQFAEELSTRLRLNLKVYTPSMSAARQEALFGKRWEQGKEGLAQYGLINKVEPMNRALTELGAQGWLSGLRRSQSSTRESLNVVEEQARTVKVYPIIDWTDRDIYLYLSKYGLPYHPLWEKGYVSIGDWHSTKPLGEDGDAQATRFNGIKRECGLHELSGQPDWQI